MENTVNTDRRCGNCEFAYPKKANTNWLLCRYPEKHTPRPGVAKPDPLSCHPDDGKDCPVWAEDVP